VAVLAGSTLVLLLAAGCAAISPASSSVGVGRPSLMSSGDPTQPDRVENQVGNRCGYACGAGFVCDAPSAKCVPLPGQSQPIRDGGAPWLP